MTAPPRVSVVMPVRDGAAFLDSAIASVRAQTFEDFEFIVVDDGSADGSLARARHHAAADLRIVVLAQAAMGIVPALNLGIHRARGEFIARMDADDISLPARFAAQVAFLDQRPDIAAAGSSATVIDTHGRGRREIVPPSDKEAIGRALLESNCMIHPAMMMRRADVIAAGLYRTGFPGCEDYDLWLRLSERSGLANIPRPLLLYREHAGQSSWRDLEQRLTAEAAVLRAAARRRASSGTSGGTSSGVPNGTDDRNPGAAIRGRAMRAARGAIGEGRRSDASAALRVAMRQGLMPPLEAARWLRLVCKAGAMPGARHEPPPQPSTIGVPSCQPR